MGKIYVVGMGSGDVSQLTLGAVECIHSGRKNFLRTKEHPSVKYFLDKGVSFESYDSWYENAKDFSKLYERIAEDLISKAEEFSAVNYFVPGNPLVAERSVSFLYEKNAEIEIIQGISFIEPVLEITRSDPIDGFKILNAEVLTYRDLDIHCDTILTQVYNRRILSEAKLSLSEVYGDEYEIYLIHNAGIRGEESVENIPIYELDRGKKVGVLSSVFIPKMPEIGKKRFDFNDVLCIIELLRGVGGCRWREIGTHQSVGDVLTGDACEFFRAVDEYDTDRMIEKLGDLLFDVAFHMTIAREDGIFPHDVTTALLEKIIGNQKL